MLTLPTVLTLSRIFVIPILVFVFWLPPVIASWLALVLFIAAAVTDYFDGFLARRNDDISRFGTMLDPIADKLMVAAGLLLLADASWGLGGIHLLAATAILGREIMISGLREYLGLKGISLPVSRLGKWKTTLQLIAVGFLIAGPAGASIDLPLKPVGLGLLWLAAVLTLWSGWDYVKSSLKHLDDRRPGADEVAG